MIAIFRINRTVLLLGSALVAVPAVAESPKAAETAAVAKSGEPESIDDIVVTARKKSESLLDTPITVSVATAEYLDRANIRNALDLANKTPGFTFESIGPRSNAKPIIRGVTTNSVTPSQQKNSSFIDGIYVGGTTTPPPFIEIDRIEVLKGPQSAAFGRATFAGAINYIMKEPGDRLAIQAQVLAATDQEYEGGALVSGPLTRNGVVRAQVAGYYRTYGGNREWVNSDGRRLGTEETYYGAATLLIEPDPGFKLKLRYQFLRLNDGPTPVRFVSDAQRNGLFNVTLDRARGAAPVGTTFTQRFPLGVVGESTRPYAQDFSVVSDPGTHITKQRWTAALDADLWAGHTLNLTAGYNTDKTNNWESDNLNRPCSKFAVPTAAFCSLSVQRYSDFQMEGRIASAQDKPFSYLVGLFYLTSKERNNSAQPVTGSLFFPVNNLNINSLSPFGSVSLKIGRATLGGEVRYNIDQITNFGYRTCLYPTTSSVAGVPCLFNGEIVGNPFTGEPGAPLERRDRTFKTVVYRLTADYKITDDLMIYGIVSKGNQPGFFNLGTGFPERFRVVDEELLYNYELGFKGKFLNGKGYFTIAGFRMDWKNQVFRRTLNLVNLPSGEVVEFDSSATYPAGSTNFQSALNVNQGSSRIYGVEAEVGLQPFEGFDMRGTLAYTHARLLSFCSEFLYQLTLRASLPNGRCLNVDGNRLEAQPDWTYSISMGYKHDIGRAGLSGYVRGDFSYIGTKFDSEMNLAQTGAAKLLGLQAGVENDRWRFEAFATNLLDDDTPTRLGRLTDATVPATAAGVTPAGAAVTVTAISQQSVAVVPRRNRQFGIRASVKF